MSWGVNEQWLRSMPYPLFHWMIHWLRTVKYWKHQGTMCPSTSSCWQTWSAGKIPPLCSRIVPFKPPFIGIIPMFFQWFSHDVAIQTSIYREFSYMYHYVSICPIYSHDFPMIFLYSHDFPMFFPMIFLWFFYDVPMKTIISAGILSGPGARPSSCVSACTWILEPWTDESASRRCPSIYVDLYL